MRCFFLVIFLLFPISAFAQQDESISNNVHLKQQITTQNRRLLLDKFYANRLDRVELLLDSIDRHYPAQPLLLPAERLLLYFWIERFDDVDYLARNFDAINKKVAANPPQDQAVWNALSYHSEEKYDMLFSWINQNAYSLEESVFFGRLLNILLKHEIDDPLSLASEIRLLVKQYDQQNSPPVNPIVKPRKEKPPKKQVLIEEIEADSFTEYVFGLIIASIINSRFIDEEHKYLALSAGYGTNFNDYGFGVSWRITNRISSFGLNAALGNKNYVSKSHGYKQPTNNSIIWSAGLALYIEEFVMETKFGSHFGKGGSFFNNISMGYNWFFIKDKYNEGKAGLSIGFGSGLGLKTRSYKLGLIIRM